MEPVTYKVVKVGIFFDEIFFKLKNADNHYVGNLHLEGFHHGLPLGFKEKARRVTITFED